MQNPDILNFHDCQLRRWQEGADLFETHTIGWGTIQLHHSED